MKIGTTYCMSGLECTQSKKKPLRYRKQLIYEGTHHQIGRDGKPQKFALERKHIDHFATESNNMIRAGGNVPWPVGHTEDPEKTRATTVRFETGKDSQGRYSLYGITDFRDEEAAKLALTSDVSVNVPDQKVYANGKSFDFPVTHVAFTDYPAVANLDSFTAIAASLVTDKQIMPKTNEPAETKKEGMGLVLSAAQNLVDAITAHMGEGKKKPEPKPADPAPAADPATSAPIAASLTQAPAEPNQVLLDMMARVRNQEIDQLVLDRKVTPAGAKQMKETHVSDSALRMSAIDDDAGRMMKNMYESAIATAKSNPAIVSTESQTTSQLSLSREDHGDPKKDPLAAAMERRIKARG